MSGRPAAARGGGTATRLAILAVFAGAVVVFFASGAQRYVDLDAVKANRDALLAFTEQHYPAGARRSPFSLTLAPSRSACRWGP